eukprot:PhF_6_TR39632/c3_g1_i2/m.58728
MQPQPISITNPSAWSNTFCQFHLEHCLVSCCASCNGLTNCLYGYKRSEMDRSDPITAMFCVSPCGNRTLMREAYGIEGSWQEDAVKTVCCPCCAYTQMAVEFDRRGNVVTFLPPATQDWKNGLCSCDGCRPICLYSCIGCTQMIYSIKQMNDKTDWMFNFCALTPCASYTMMRERYGIQGNSVLDCCTLTCCYPCATNRLRMEWEMREYRPSGVQWSNSLFDFNKECCLACGILSLTTPLAAVIALLSVNTYGCLVFGLTMWPFQYLFGRQRANVQGIDPCATGCTPCCGNMTMIREAYGIQGHWQDDACQALCCPCFAYGRIVSEVKHRGNVRLGVLPLSDITPFKVPLCSCDCTSLSWYSCCLPHETLSSLRQQLDDTTMPSQPRDWMFRHTCLMSYSNYNALRTHYNIEGTFYNDCLYVTFCLCCSTNRIRKEIEKRRQESTSAQALEFVTFSNMR